MKKITEQVVRAFISRKKCKVNNTHTDGNTLYLHGNAIATWTDDNQLLIRSAGWQTRTTRERLNGLLYLLNKGIHISQKNWVWHLGTTPWYNTYEWTLVN